MRSGNGSAGRLRRAAWTVVRRRRLTPRNRSESTCYHADRRPICTLNNTAKRRNAKSTAVNRLGICYSTARNVDPSELRHVNTLQCRSASNHCAEQQAGASVKFSPHRKTEFSRAFVSHTIRAAHRRLAGVQIERLDWQEFIRRYDRDFTLFYLDPPYWGHEAAYGKGVFAREDFGRMADVLRGLKGRFILSLNDRPEVRETFAGFRFEEVSAAHTVNAKAARRVAELLISNG